MTSFPTPIDPPELFQSPAFALGMIAPARAGALLEIEAVAAVPAG
ncbi:hypothetical protein [Cryobacterium sp. TMS1-13-1]|nr:hypothetical protein [Cryobacterium sp. TMS1-13-1]